MKTQTSINEFLDRLSSAPASALLLDYDGTLAPFQTDRFEAYPYPGIVTLLDRILCSGKTKVVVISGRPVREIQALLCPLRNLEIWGAHGFERLLADGQQMTTVLDPQIRELLHEAGEWLREIRLSPMAEVKPGGIAIHWRGLPKIEIHRVHALVEEGWAEIARSPELKLLQFDGGLELRTAHPDKGDAVTSILKESSPNVEIAFLGDDITDEDAFGALDGRGLSVLVRSAHRPTRANAWLRPPHELIDFLSGWLKALSD
jgi:trehalose 6-phosphate phosphatase